MLIAHNTFEDRCDYCREILPSYVGKYVCCDGRDCACGGVCLDWRFCSTTCFENFHGITVPVEH